MSRYPNSVDQFTRKKNKRNSPRVAEDEIIAASDGVGEATLKHDNVNRNTIEIWTGEGKTGTEITSYLLETPSHMEWKTNLRVFTNEPQVYVSYEFDGDQVEAEDINELQTALEATQTELDRHKENDPHADMRQSEYDTNYDGKVDRADVADTAESVAWSDVDGKPSEYPPEYHRHTEAEISDLDKYDRATVDEKLADKTDTSTFETHTNDTTNPHDVNKSQVGLGNVDNVKQATKTEFDAHNNDSTRHITSAERNNWNDAEGNANAYTDTQINDVQADITSHVDDFNAHDSDNSRHITDNERNDWNAKEDAANKGQPDGYASLNADGQIVNAEIPANLKEVRVVSDIAERDALTGVYEGMRVHVRDASADGNVDGGWAEYLWTGTEWTKTAENESIDVILDWYDVENKPAEYPPESHTHTESDITDLDKYTKAEIDSMLEDTGAGDMLKSVYDTDDSGSVDSAESVPWTGVTGKPSSYTPTAHSHEISEVNGLQNELDNKMRTGPVTWNDLKGGGD